MWLTGRWIVVALALVLMTATLAEAQRRIVIRPPTGKPVRPTLPAPRPEATPPASVTPARPETRAPTPQAEPPRGTGTGRRPNLQVPSAPRPAPRPVLAGLVAERDFRARTVLVRLVTGAAAPDLATALAPLDLDVLDSHSSALLQGVVLRLGLGTVPLEEVITALSPQAEVVLASPEMLFRTVAGDAPPAPQYALASVNLPSDAAARDVRIAVIDTGADLAHPELAQAQVLSYSGLSDRAYEAADHGSRILGILGARSRLSGVAPGARYLSAQAFAPEADGRSAVAGTFDLIRALDWAAGEGAQVFNLSFAGAPDRMLAQALGPLVARGAVLVAAAGNGGAQARPAFPAARAGVWGVTAIDGTGALYAQATPGPHVDLAAPGVDILSISVGGGYGLDSGTSLAVAHVAGAAGLVLSTAPDLSSDAVLARLQAAAKDLGAPGKDERFGAGALNIGAAIARP
ncbi:MAG: S8 family serine peptidase [Pseudomonadota bacterium]